MQIYRYSGKIVALVSLPEGANKASLREGGGIEDDGRSQRKQRDSFGYMRIEKATRALPHPTRVGSSPEGEPN